MTAAGTQTSTRDRLLDAFETLLKDGGSRAATLDAVASAAEVSKGGLLYHFPSKDDLVAGMLARIHEMGDADVARMRTAECGPVDFYLQTSVDTGSPFDRALIAAARIAQESPGSPEGQRARDTMARLRQGWFEVLAEHLGDDSLARTVQLIGDGLYFDDITGLAHGGSLDHVRDTLRRLGAL
ncbi:MAG: TetR/AcrR family transcriptional regulator [Nocardioidaceae bacterium]|nr:TetR/AcrR family transcriptional regulator [Nocardioidaceae bacterium]